MPLDVIKKLVTSSYVQIQVSNACQCLTNENIRPIIMKDFVSMRDTLTLYGWIAEADNEIFGIPFGWVCRKATSVQRGSAKASEICDQNC